MIQMKYGLAVDATLAPILNPVPDPGGTFTVTEVDAKDRTAATVGHVSSIWGLEAGWLPYFIAGKAALF